MPFTATVLTMFPEAFPGPLGVSLIGTAWREQDLWRLDPVDIRAFSADKRGFLDDTPAGGGPGQVMRADVIASALDSVEALSRLDGPKPAGVAFGVARKWRTAASNPYHPKFLPHYCPILLFVPDDELEAQLCSLIWGWPPID